MHARVETFIHGLPCDAAKGATYFDVRRRLDLDGHSFKQVVHLLSQACIMERPS